MSFAHQGFELKPLPGQPPYPPAPAAVAANGADVQAHAAALSHESIEVISGVENLARGAARRRAAAIIEKGEDPTRVVSVNGRIGVE
jgi:hypothetical protein